MTYMDLRLSHPKNPLLGAKVIHKTALALAPWQVGTENVKMGKRELGAFLRKSRGK
jgi:hypothetical protein